MGKPKSHLSVDHIPGPPKKTRQERGPVDGGALKHGSALWLALQALGCQKETSNFTIMALQKTLTTVHGFLADGAYHSEHMKSTGSGGLWLTGSTVNMTVGTQLFVTVQKGLGTDDVTLQALNCLYLPS